MYNVIFYYYLSFFLLFFLAHTKIGKLIHISVKKKKHFLKFEYWHIFNCCYLFHHTSYEPKYSWTQIFLRICPLQYISAWTSSIWKYRFAIVQDIFWLTCTLECHFAFIKRWDKHTICRNKFWVINILKSFCFFFCPPLLIHSWVI